MKKFQSLWIGRINEKTTSVYHLCLSPESIDTVYYGRSPGSPVFTAFPSMDSGCGVKTCFFPLVERGLTVAGTAPELNRIPF